MGRHRSFPTSNTLHASVIGSASDVFRVMQRGQELPSHPFQKRTPARLQGLPHPSLARLLIRLYSPERLTDQ